MRFEKFFCLTDLVCYVNGRCPPMCFPNALTAASIARCLKLEYLYTTPTANQILCDVRSSNKNVYAGRVVHKCANVSHLRLPATVSYVMFCFVSRCSSQGYVCTTTN